MYNNTQFLNPCGVGALGFVGRQFHVFKQVHGEALGLVNVDAEEGLSAGGLLEDGAGPASGGVEAMYAVGSKKWSVSGVGFASKQFRSTAESPRRRGFGGAKDSAKKDAIFGGALVDPFKREFGGYASVGAAGVGVLPWKLRSDDES